MTVKYRSLTPMRALVLLRQLDEFHWQLGRLPDSHEKLWNIRNAVGDVRSELAQHVKWGLARKQRAAKRRKHGRPTKNA